MIRLFKTRKTLSNITLSDIQTLRDVKHFFKLLKKYNISFHPDDDFDNYISLPGPKQSFSPSEASRLDAVMDQCFQVCNVKDVDIYEIAIKIQK